MNPGRERIGLLPPGAIGMSSGGIRDGIISIRNTTATAVEAYGILQVDDPVVVPSDDDPNSYEPATILNGIAPITNHADDNCGFGRFCVARHKIHPNEIGLAQISGLTHVKLLYLIGNWNWVDIGATEGAITSTMALHSHPAGSAGIVWVSDTEDERGLYNAIVNLSFRSNNATISGVANGAVAKDAEGQCTPYLPVVNEGEDEDHNDVPFLNTLAAIEDGAFILIHWERMRNRFVLGPATCTN